MKTLPPVLAILLCGTVSVLAADHDDSVLVHEMKNKRIPNVPVIRYDGNNAGMYTTLLGAALQSIGEECNRAKLTALSGAGNRFCWVDGKWHGGCEMPAAINEAPFETERRVLNAIGWKAKYVTVQRDTNGHYLNTDPGQIRRDFVESMDKGFPVIAYLVKRADCNVNLYFGYENDGQKIISYEYNKGLEPGVATNNETPVSEDNWEDNIAGYIVFQEKEEAASERNTALSAFTWISGHAGRTTEINGKLVGFAAWKSYLHLLEHDDFSEVSSEDVKKRFGIYCDGLCQIWERSEALDYYRSLAEKFPEWKYELNIAVAALNACAWYGGFVWTEGFSFDNAGLEKFRDPAARKSLADAGRVAMLNDMEAVRQFEKILKKEGRIK